MRRRLTWHNLGTRGIWRWLEKYYVIQQKRRHKPVPAPPAPKPPAPPTPTPTHNIEMYDDIYVSTIPVSAEAVAGYVDGKWPTYAQLVKRFPHATHVVSIAVFAADNADALDIEPGDATIAQAAAWVKRQHARGENHPILYTSVAQAELLIQALDHAGLVFGKDYLLWTAHYTDVAHLCSSKCEPSFTHVAHATQWTDKAGGKSLDESLVAAEFFA